MMSYEGVSVLYMNIVLSEAYIKYASRHRRDCTDGIVTLIYGNSIYALDFRADQG